VEVLARTLASLAPKVWQNAPLVSKKFIFQILFFKVDPVGDDEKRLLLSLMLCLGEWCHQMPGEMLLSASNEEGGRSLLQQVFAALQVGPFWARSFGRFL